MSLLVMAATSWSLIAIFQIFTCAVSPASNSQGSNVCVITGDFMVVYVSPKMSVLDSSPQSYSMLESSTRLPMRLHVGEESDPVLRYRISSFRSTTAPAVVLKVRSAMDCSPHYFFDR